MINQNWHHPRSKQETEPLHWGHLGGTSVGGDVNAWYPELWDWLIHEFSLSSVLDVGCGVGYAQQFFRQAGLKTLGIDCNQMKSHHLLPGDFVGHDLITGPLVLEEPVDQEEFDPLYGRSYPPPRFDIVWCCDVAEHVEEEFVDNVIETVVGNVAKVVAFSAAPLGAGGYHHVNCQNPPYWVEKFTSVGLTYEEDLTRKAKELCPVAYGRTEKNYFLRSGLIFTVKF